MLRTCPTCNGSRRVQRSVSPALSRLRIWGALRPKSELICATAGWRFARDCSASPVRSVFCLGGWGSVLVIDLYASHVPARLSSVQCACVPRRQNVHLSRKTTEAFRLRPLQSRLFRDRHFTGSVGALAGTKAASRGRHRVRWKRRTSSSVHRSAPELLLLLGLRLQYK
jgi:hypothetical protein